MPFLAPVLAGFLAAVAGTVVAAPPASPAAASTVPADESPQALLQRMSRTLATRSYDGEFLHLSGGRIERLQVVHRRDARGVVERLRVMGEPGREVIRQGEELRVYLPDERRVLVDRAPRPGAAEGAALGPLGRLPAFDAGIDRHYHIVLEGRETSIIGRPARVILVRPRDGYRLGYRLWIDERTAMPTRTDLFDAEGRVVEQLVFTALRLRSHIDDAELQPSPGLRGFAVVQQGPPPPPPGGIAPAPAGRWGLARLPPGFRIARRGLQWLPGNPAPAAHLVVTDGLATVSVFVQRTPPGRRQIEGPGRLGAASAYSTVVDGHQVTAVGEVPARTVEAIARQVVPE